ncbi:MAG: 4Fe-4S binding protein [Candidatus Odinarchaeota archaeon]
MAKNETRQKIRFTVLLVTFLVLPVIFNYLSPYVILDGASQGIIAGSAIVFFLMFLSSLYFGRFYCGWICPAAGMQEYCMNNINNRKIGSRRWFKWVIWIPWILMFVILLLTAQTLTVNFFHLTENFVSIDEPMKWFTFYTVMLLIFGVTVYGGRRAFCHHVCWMAPFMIIGTKIRNSLNLPGLRLKADKDKCTNCKKCNKVCSMSLDVNAMVQSEGFNNLDCVLCGSCVDNCPKKVIHYSFK